VAQCQHNSKSVSLRRRVSQSTPCSTIMTRLHPRASEAIRPLLNGFPSWRTEKRRNRDRFITASGRATPPWIPTKFPRSNPRPYVALMHRNVVTVS